jgi:hypothetical protein
MDRVLSYKGKNTGSLICLGILIGIISVVSPGAVFDLVLTLAIAFTIYRFLDKEDKYFLLKLFIFGLLLRMVLLLVVQYFLILNNKWFYMDIFGGRAAYLFGDDGYYTLRSWGLTRHIQGARVGDAMLDKTYELYGYSFYLYILSFFYYLFGFSPISVTFINCILSVLTGIVYYFTAKEITDERSARIAAVLIVFFPSLMVWSISNLKDSIVIFLMSITIFAFLRWVKTDKIFYVFLMLAVFFARVLMRPKFIMLEYGIALWACAFYLYLKRKPKLAYILLAIMIVIMVWPILGPKLAVYRNIITYYGRGAGSGEGFFYRIYDDWVYKQGANTNLVTNFEILKASLRGWLHFFLEPFPWKIRSVLSAASLPQMILWYAVIPFGVLGLFSQLKSERKITLALLAFILLVGTGFAITGANIGTGFRMRDMLTPLILLFAAVGLRNIFWIRR